MDLKKEAKDTGKSLLKAIADFALPKSRAYRLLLLGSVIILFLAWLTGGTQAEGTEPATAPFCVTASGYGGEFHSKKVGSCLPASTPTPTPSEEVVTATYEIQWQCGSITAASCGFTTLTATFPSALEVASVTPLYLGKSYAPLIEPGRVTWKVEEAVQGGNAGTVTFTVVAKPSQLDGISVSLTGPDGQPVGDTASDWIAF